jgi:hypothetical protein
VEVGLPRKAEASIRTCILVSGRSNPEPVDGRLYIHGVKTLRF